MTLVDQVAERNAEALRARQAAAADDLLDDAIAREEMEDQLAREEEARRAQRIEEQAREEAGHNAYLEKVKLHLRELLPVLLQNRRRFSPLVEEWLVDLFMTELGYGSVSGTDRFEQVGAYVSQGQDT